MPPRSGLLRSARRAGHGDAGRVTVKRLSRSA